MALDSSGGSPPPVVSLPGMNPSQTRLLVGGVLGVALIAALFLLLRPDDGEDTGPTATGGEVARQQERSTSDKKTVEDKPKPTIPAVVVVGGEPRGGILRINARQDNRIAFKVRADISDEIHVHGYDISREITPGRPVTMRFKADITGIFEVELEHSAVPIAELTINP